MVSGEYPHYMETCRESQATIEQVPPAFDGPTPFGTNDTYLTRAKAYVAAGDK